MGGVAFVFPGQGTAGGGLSPELRSTIEEVTGASEVPYQLSVFAGSVECLRVLRERGVEPAAVAGHSLGEYTAAYAAGCFGLKEAIRLVAERDRLMTEAARRNPGKMVAVLRADPEEVVAAAESVSGVVVAANFNTPRQTVLSGAPEAVEEAAGKVGGRKIPLKVIGAFHSELMRDASEGMCGLLEAAEVRDPEYPLVSGLDGRVLETGDQVRRALQEQMLSPVRWVAVIERLAALGVEEVVEVGEGGTLVRMLKDFGGLPFRGRVARELPV
ncbi:ACP S-malonyltransferase [Rubrobacter taiwanensis]|uniref:ACP S-malonyltransferase n=1 Tax=Rubrobacter taiwanensis TaxID=185139 RepID=UPI0014042A13|nr:ACP S-malonyltransferase [Rubrobacter taiwanensis]